MEEVKCPVCGSPLVDGYCNVCFAFVDPQSDEEDHEISSKNQSDPQQDSATPSEGLQVTPDGEGAGTGSPSEQEAFAACEKVACPQCGWMGSPGQTCMQCQTVLPVSPSNAVGQIGANNDRQTAGQAVCEQSMATATVSEAVPAVLVFPHGQRISLPNDRDLDIGRESVLPAIRQALWENKRVSRHHCVLRINSRGRTVTVKDSGSTNGTFWEQGGARISHEESRPLPTALWLGSQTRLWIDV